MAEPLITGFVLTPESLETTTLAGSRKRAAAGELPLSGPPAETLAAAQAAKRLEGALHAALPAQSSLINVIDLPTRDPQEIAGMVSLRTEEWTPFAIERTCSSWELLCEIPGGCRIAVVLAPLPAVQALRDALISRHLQLQRVDIDVFAWLRLLRDAAALPTSGHHLLLILHREQTHLLLLVADQPLLFRSLSETRLLDPETLRTELSHALASLQAEWGITTLDSLRVWHDAEAPAWADEHVAGLPCTLRSLQELPSLCEGVTLRSLSGARFDLSPPQWKTEEARIRQRRHLLRAALVAAALWVFAVGGLVLGVQLRDRQIRALREQARRQEKPVAEILTLQSRVRSLSQFTDRSHSALEALRLLAEAMPSPASLSITDFQYRKEQGLTFSGDVLAGESSFYSFIENLTGKGLIRVENYNVKQQRGRSEFQVNALWNWIPADGGDS
jgi:hypothetical protein